MSIVGFQEFLQVGGRCYFKRDAIGGVEQALVDLGVIQSVKPTVTPTKVELYDPDGGVQRRVDVAVPKIDESWEIQCSNFNMDNMALLFMSGAPVDYTVAAAHKRVTHFLHAGRLKELHDSDAASTRVYGLGAIAGIMSAAVSAGVLTTAAVSAVDVATKKITIGASDLTAHFTVGKVFILEGTGLANILNARTYTVVSSAFVGGKTEVTVSEAPAANEAAIAGSVIYKATGDSGTIYAQDIDWEVVSVDRGILRVKSGGAIATDANKVVVYSTAAITGKRRISPQSSGDVQGKFEVWMGTGSNANQWVREARVSIVPSGTDLKVEDFSSFTLTVSVLSAVTSTDAGTLTKVKGALPSAS